MHSPTWLTSNHHLASCGSYWACTSLLASGFFDSSERTDVITCMKTRCIAVGDQNAPFSFTKTVIHNDYKSYSWYLLQPKMLYFCTQDATSGSWLMCYTCLFRVYSIMRSGVERKIPPPLPPSKLNPSFVLLSSTTWFSEPSQIFFLTYTLLECVYRRSTMACACLIFCLSIILPHVLIFYIGSELAVQCWEILCCLKWHVE